MAFWLEILTATLESAQRPSTIGSGQDVGGLAHMAERAFEIIYGCDPVAFLEHVTAYRG